MSNNKNSKKQGAVECTRDGQRVSLLKTGDFFGERSLLKKTNREATVTVTSKTASVLTISKSDFDLLLGPLADLMSNHQHAQTKGTKRASHLSQPQHRLTEMVSALKIEQQQVGTLAKDNFRTLGLLGCGAFGAVYLMKYKKTGATYAVKALSKGIYLKCVGVCVCLCV